MKAPIFRRRRLAFTLVELLVVLGIIALLGTLFNPALSSAMARARSLKCSTNLRSIGVAASLAAADNNNAYPEIDQAAIPIYTPQGPSLLTALGPYNISAENLKCPVDFAMGSSSSYETYSQKFGTNYASSYEWDPVFDDEEVSVTVVYITPTVAVPVNSARVRLAMDFNPIHHGRPNVVYGDGHVSNH
jgi:prepilin-type N-terminal cleavage/methylation domain-containing protein/prepilin-type processing-associated H-X9-DG protein